MGRYYSGDIEGKFWFAVQSSDDASFFGGSQSEPNYINYSFDKDDLSTIEEGIKKCIEHLGDKKQALDSFFETNNGYNDEKLSEALSIKKEEVSDLLEWYARLELGEKILKCVQEQGYCEFEAEL